MSARKKPTASRKDDDVRARVALAAHPLLAGCSQGFVDQVLARARVQTFAAGETLSREGDAADYWFLCVGSTRVFYRSPLGNEVTVKLFSAPAAWAEMEVLTHRPHMEDCAAVDRVVAVRVPARQFVLLLDAEPRFCRNVLEDCAARFYIAAQSEKKLAFASVEERIAHLLLSYLRLFGVPVDGGTHIRVKLSHTDIANGIGAAQKSVTRTLTTWQKAGWISKRGTSYVVHALDKIEGAVLHPVPGIDFIAGRGVRS
ncbi:MAG: Crp/Fnr family transcriptional regulator [Deltaproteobacteria bacterium]|nr:Crp/Fnr family transcriptional regulator [Deltaproteobacteria bacterium]